MGGAILQLSMRGKQDQFLNIKPELELFKAVFYRHSGFAMETQELFFNSTNFGNRSVCVINKDADLLTGITLRLQLPSLNITSSLKKSETCVKDVDITCFCSQCTAKTSETVFGWANSIGHLIPEEYSFNVGSKEINKNTGEWLEWNSELSQTAEKKNGYWEMIGKREPASFKPTTFSDSMDLLIPLEFFFTGNAGLAFPLVAIDEDNITVEIKWRNFDDCWICNKSGLRPAITPQFRASLLIDTVYLDKMDRDKFQNENHLYLIEQIQRNCPTYYPQSTSLPITELNFTLSTKSIHWAILRNDINERSADDDPDFSYGNDWFNYACYRTRYKNIIKDPFETGKLTLNGEDRMMPLPAKYYRLLQSYTYNRKTPSNYIYSYNFCFKPNEHQPTGTINFSMYTRIKLNLKMYDNYPTDFNILVYAVSYNFLIIKDRKVSLAYVI